MTVFVTGFHTAQLISIQLFYHLSVDHKVLSSCGPLTSIIRTEGWYIELILTGVLSAPISPL